MSIDGDQYVDGRVQRHIVVQLHSDEPITPGWQILHAAIRRRAAPDEGLDFHPQLENMGVLMRNAREEGVSEFDIIMELAGFGATFATMTKNDPLTVAAAIERDVMAERDEDDDT